MANPYSKSRFPLPSGMQTQASEAWNQQALDMLEVEGLKVKYIGPGEDDSQAAAIMTNNPVPPDCPLYYFEVRVLDQGEHGYIAVGFMASHVLLPRLPGWEANSYGYHGDDGCAFNSSGMGRPFGPTYGTGDTIGALWNREERTIRYFKNGVDLGVAFSGVGEERLYPCVGLRTQGEEMLLNLGAEHFVGYDIAAAYAALEQQL